MESKAKRFAFVFDTETTIRNRGPEAIGKMGASSFHPDNKIVMLGHKAVLLDPPHEGATNTESPIYIEDTDVYLRTLRFLQEAKTDPEYTVAMFVGHNLKFDILHLYAKHYKDFEPLIRDSLIWDTQFAEYLLSGQTVKYAAMDELAPQYGGVLKDKKIKEYWEAGVDTTDIPKNELSEYLVGDVENTALIFKGQLTRAIENGMFKFILAQMEGLKATIEMEYNGMHINVKGLKVEEKQLQEKIEHHEDVAKALMYGLAENNSYPGGSASIVPLLNPTSNDHITAAIYGGTITVRPVLPAIDELGRQVRYKTGQKKGQPKFERREVRVNFPKTQLPVIESTPAGKISVSDSALEKLKQVAVLSQRRLALIETVQTIRKLSKELGTYVRGYGALVWPTDSCIHPNYSHCSTDTGRLSCSAPNVQNISKKEMDNE